MSTNRTQAEVTRETYRETPDEFFARMKKRGEFTVAHRAVQAREQRNKKDSNIKKADALHKAFEYTSTVTFPFTDAEWAEVRQRVEADTKAPAEHVDERPKPAEASNAPLEDDPTTTAELDALVARCDGDPVDLERDLTWAYGNLGKRTGTVRPADAPSAGAWTQLGYARRNQTKFIETVNKILGKQVEERNASRDRDDRSSLETLHRRFETEMLGMP